MKTKNVILTALLAMFVSVLALAKDPGTPKLVVLSQKSGIFKVIYEGSKTERVSLKIYDYSGAEVFAETISSKGFIRPFNFEGMAAGEYTIEIADSNGKQVQKVNYLTTVDATATGTHITRITDEGKYLLAVANTGTKEINVKIFDDANNLVHNENITINGNFGQIYNLKQVTGTPTFIVTDIK
jgi:hypothetical protein